jgi:hypothetical protein
MRLEKGEGGVDPHLFKNPPPGISDHPLFRGGTTVGLMTADAPRFQAEEASGNEGLETHLRKLGLRFEPTHGSYGGPERSYFIYGPSREQMYGLGKKFGQEAVIYSQDGRHELMYTHGPNAGKYHASLPLVRYSQHQPDDYYTHVPSHGGYLTLHFDSDHLHDSPVKHSLPLAQQTPVDDHPLVNKAEVRRQLAVALRKSMGRMPHPHSYPWHEAHTGHHQRSVSHGVLLTADEVSKLFPLAKDEEKFAAPKPHPTNDQAAGAGVSTYAKYAAPYGTLDKTKPANLKFYPMGGREQDADRLLKQHGVTAYYMGGKHGKPDLANRNYNTGHVAIWAPEAGSGGDFGDEGYTAAWRKLHELAHLQTLPQLNEIYGEGRRMGGLGKQRTAREAKRAVHWEWLAAHKQRELAKQAGVHISDEDFNRELNTVMHDAVHRAVTGKFTEPSDEGFVPHAHKVPLETALGMVDESARSMGLATDHDVLRKFTQALLSTLQKRAR